MVDISGDKMFDTYVDMKRDSFGLWIDQLLIKSGCLF